MRLRRSGTAKNTDTDSGNVPGGGWEIIYTGFVLILLCFFIMLSSFATMEQSKIARFVRSFVDAVSVMSSGTGLDQNKQVAPPARHAAELTDELASVFEELTSYKAARGLDTQLEIERAGRQLVLRLADKALFEVGSARFAGDARPLLDKIGSILTRNRLHARIEGHTDNLPIANRLYPSNWELSTARAVNVLRYLLDEFAIDPQRVSAAGCGEFRSLVPNRNEENRARNRRVEIILGSN